MDHLFSEMLIIHLYLMLSFQSISFQVLISEAGGPNKKKKSKEEYKRPVSTLPKDKNVKSEADSYVEMDARILKALLNVSTPAFISLVYMIIELTCVHLY